MQVDMTMVGPADVQAQQRSKLRWLWLPTGVLMALGLGLSSINPRWSVLVMGLAALWAVLASIGFGVLEGLNLSGSGLLGNGPDIRTVGIFSHYRQRHILLANATLHAGMFAIGISLPGRVDDPVLGSLIQMALQFAIAALPMELSIWFLARRWGDWPPMRRVVSLLLPAAALSVILHHLLLAMLELLRPALVYPASWWVGVVTAAFYLATVLGVHQQSLKWQARLNQANQRADEADTARRLAEAQLAVLQAQIEPHFLYNTLATVQYLLKGEPGAADFLLTQLIRYLRLAMPSMRQFSSTLGREFELTDAYLQIARLRMGGRLSVDLDLASELEAIEFPPLVLQTLAENAIKHGVEPKTGPVRLIVNARRSGEELIVSVQDDGVGLGGAPTQGSGTGLQNIRGRLQGIYGERARLSIAGLPQGGVLASVSIPLDKTQD